jgi:hypothetical protein
MNKILLLLIASSSISLMAMNSNKMQPIKPTSQWKKTSISVDHPPFNPPPAYESQTPSAPPVSMTERAYAPAPSSNPPPAYASSAPSVSMVERAESQNEGSQNNHVAAPQLPTVHAQENATGLNRLTPLGKVCWVLACIPAVAIDTGLCPLMIVSDACQEGNDFNDEDPEEYNESCCCLTRALLRCIEVEEFCGVQTDRRHNTHQYPSGW